MWMFGGLRIVPSEFAKPSSCRYHDSTNHMVFSLSLPGVVKITLDDANLIADAELVFDTKLV